MKNKGFTLIELLVVVTMMIMVMAAIVSAMTGTFRAQTDVSLSTKAVQNGSYALLEIKRNLVNASGNTIICPVGVGTSVVFKNSFDGEQTTLVCVPPLGGNKGMIASISAARVGETIALTSQSEVSVLDCANFVQCTPNDGSGAITSLDFNFRIGAGTTQPNYLEKSFNSKISVRN